MFHTITDKQNYMNNTITKNKLSQDPTNFFQNYLIENEVEIPTTLKKIKFSNENLNGNIFECEYSNEDFFQISYKALKSNYNNLGYDLEDLSFEVSEEVASNLDLKIRILDNLTDVPITNKDQLYTIMNQIIQIDDKIFASDIQEDNQVDLIDINANAFDTFDLLIKNGIYCTENPVLDYNINEIHFHLNNYWWVFNEKKIDLLSKTIFEFDTLLISDIALFNYDLIDRLIINGFIC